MNPLNQGHCRAAPGTSRYAYGISQGTLEDDFQSDLHPEASTSHSQTPWNSGPDGALDIEEAN